MDILDSAFAGSSPPGWDVQVIGQMRSKLHLNCSPIQIPIGLEHEHRGLVDLLHMKAYDFQGKFGEIIAEVPPSSPRPTPPPLPSDRLAAHEGL